MEPQLEHRPSLDGPHDDTITSAKTEKSGPIGGPLGAAVSSMSGIPHQLVQFRLGLGVRK